MDTKQGGNKITWYFKAALAHPHNCKKICSERGSVWTPITNAHEVLLVKDILTASSWPHGHLD